LILWIANEKNAAHGITVAVIMRPSVWKMNNKALCHRAGCFFIAKIDRPDVAKLRARRGSDPREQSEARERISMDRKFLENLGLEKETIDKVLDEASKDIGKQKAAIDAKTEELKTANATINQLQEAAKQFKGVDVAALQQQITDLQAKYEADTQAIKRDAALKLAIGGRVHDPSDVIRLLDTDKLELDDDGTLKGSIDDLLKPIKESKPYLFVEDKGSTPPPVKGTKPAETGTGNPPKTYTQEELGKMSMAEYREYRESQGNFPKN
jgi:hypothetical protein